MEKIGHYFILPSSELKKYSKLSTLIYLMLKNYKRIYKLHLEKKIKVDNKGVYRIVKNLISSKAEIKDLKYKKEKKKAKKILSIKKINDDEVNKYLYSRNLLINQKVSFTLNKIKRLDHYNWWFKSKRDSFAVIINEKKIMYLYDETFQINFKNYSLQGWFATKNKFGIKELLLALNWHRKHMAKKKNIDLSFGIIKKDNQINFSKYLGWIPIKNDSKEFKILKKISQVNKNYNYYIRH